MLCPQAQRTAKTASPKVPFNGHLARRPSAFMCPISGSMPLRRFSSFASTGVSPRRVPLISTRVVPTPWPRYPRSTTARSGASPVRIVTCSSAAARVWPSSQIPRGLHRKDIMRQAPRSGQGRGRGRSGPGTRRATRGGGGGVPASGGLLRMGRAADLGADAAPCRDAPPRGGHFVRKDRGGWPTQRRTARVSAEGEA